jgi:hemerythrin
MPSEIQQLPVSFMNEDHAQALIILDKLLDSIRALPADRTSVSECFQEFLNHSREHFDREEKAMASSRFPPYPIHKSEHDRVLTWLEHILATLRADTLSVTQLTGLGAEIKTWFFQHIQSMDAVTANWVASHQTN